MKKNLKRKALVLLMSFAMCMAMPLTAFAEYTTTISQFTYKGLILPAFDGDMFEVVNGNNTYFTAEEKASTEAYESYSELDSLGRVGVAMANIDTSLMPAAGEERGSISSVYPTGWVQNKYDIVSGKYLYNRSHLIGWQLTAENANKKNLMTGTRSFNVDGMLPVENTVANYIKTYDKKVLYRVTPVFRGDNLLADGVLMEAESLEDESINICVYCFNIQPGIAINYATGENRLASDTEPDDTWGGSLIRKYGDNRYDTAIAIADELKSVLGVSTFDTIVVANGDDYPDALAGGYLASLKDAPILLVNTSNESKVLDYIENNISNNGKVYILGGTGVVRQQFQDALKSKSKVAEVKRLSGANRYDTNLEILKEAGVNGKDVLVSSGDDYADSLSASATELPILLVGSSLTDKQKEFLGKQSSSQYFIVGGTGAVNGGFENAIKQSAGGDNVVVTRFAGANRFETSSMVAYNFFNPSSVDTVTLAYGNDFPDGLAGGPLAATKGAPLLLAGNSNYSYAGSFIKQARLNTIYVFGGPTLISDGAIGNMFK